MATFLNQYKLIGKQKLSKVVRSANKPSLHRNHRNNQPKVGLEESLIERRTAPKDLAHCIYFVDRQTMSLYFGFHYSKSVKNIFLPKQVFKVCSQSFHLLLGGLKLFESIIILARACRDLKHLRNELTLYWQALG